MPTPTFDGDNLLVTLAAPSGGVLDLDVQVDLYSDWKEWMLASFANMKYPPLFTTFGGDGVTVTIDAGAYYKFNNAAGWRIKPDESDHDVTMIGSLIALDATLPMFTPTTGGFTVLVNGVQPITTVVAVGSGVLPADIDAIEAQIFARIVEGGFSFEEIIRLIAASSAGTITQETDGTYTITGIDGATARVLGALGTNNSRDISSRDGT